MLMTANSGVAGILAEKGHIYANGSADRLAWAMRSHAKKNFNAL